MNTKRRGKIARLPKGIREQLNRRLADGESGARLVGWLNGLPEVSVMLAQEFAGQPIREQNLSDWRLGGYEDWVKQQEALAWVRSVSEEADELGAGSGNASFTDRLSVLAAVQVGRWLRELSAQWDGSEQQCQQLQSLCQELAKLRRGDQEARWLRLAEERWQDEIAKEKRKLESNPVSRMLLTRVLGSMLEDMPKAANGEVPADLMSFILRGRRDQPGDQRSKTASAASNGNAN